jgi:hypothetical protein
MADINLCPLHTQNGSSEENTTPVNWKDNKETFIEWYGMDEIIDAYAAAVGLNDDKANINGWAALAVIHGPEKVVSELNTNLATIQIVCGLLLSFTFSLLVSPTDSISELPRDSAAVVSYGAIMSLSNICFLLTIILGTIVELGLNSCGRVSDTYRMILAIGWLPTCIYTMFTVSIALMSLGFGIAMYDVYGNILSSLFVIVLVSLCFLCNWISVKVVLPQGHVVHGWRKNTAFYDMRIPFEKIRNAAELSRQYKMEYFPTKNQSK